VPLFKRLAGSEFCSDAHRREYQQEYSQLALGRLMQSNPNEAQAQLAKVPLLRNASAPAVEEPPAPAAKSSATHARVETVTQPNGIAKSQAPPAAPSKKTVPQPATAMPAVSQPATAMPAVSQSATAMPGVSQPATAKAAPIQKPAPADLQFAVVGALAAAPEFEHAFASLAPDRPRHRPDLQLAELPQGRSIAWEGDVEIADSIPQPVERKLDLREVSRPIPTIALDLRIVPPESLETERGSLAITTTFAAPAEAFLWSGSHCDFAVGLVSLSSFADDQFSKSDFEAPVSLGGSAVSAGVEPSLPEPQPATAESEAAPQETNASFAEHQSAAPTPTVTAPDPQLDPLPVSFTGVTPPRVKPVPVFGPAPLSAGTIQIPQPNGLPLRPVMVLAAAAPAPVVQTRKANGLSLRSALSIKPSQQSTTLGSLSSTPNLGLPELPMQASAGPMPSLIRKIVTAITGAAVLGAGIFFFLGKQSDAGLKSPARAVADGALGAQWIANFAPDAQRQRRVSVLRSSTNLSAYRLDFESSIRVKALGWVYRAQDSKNFYVSKIELQKPGQNPVYALVHYAVINGVEQPRVETPLHVTVPMGGFYKVRFEASGNRFTTWIQGQRVEQWTDSRLTSGGAGLFGEGVEQSTLHGEFVVTPLSK
jgi:hypothetical protein